MDSETEIPGRIDVATLEGALNSTRSQIADLQGRIGQMQRELGELEREEKLLGNLLALRTGGSLREEERGNDASAATRSACVEKPDGSTSSMMRVGSSPVADAAALLIEEHGRPVHISELMRLLVQQKVKIPGAGSQANLISYLRRDPRIVRPSRGTYGLAHWGLAEMNPKPVARTRRKRRRVRKSS